LIETFRSDPTRLRSDEAAEVEAKLTASGDVLSVLHGQLVRGEITQQDYARKVAEAAGVAVMPPRRKPGRPRKDAQVEATPA
jgi:hypothetical protein